MSWAVGKSNAPVSWNFGAAGFVSGANIVVDGGLTLLLAEQDVYQSLNASQQAYVIENASVAAEGPRRFALGASLACLAAALWVSVFPGWVIARL